MREDGNGEKTVLGGVKTLGHEGFAGLVASVALLDEVLGHPVGPRRRQRVLGRLVVIPQPRALAHAHELGRVVSGLCRDRTSTP